MTENKPQNLDDLDERLKMHIRDLTAYIKASAKLDKRYIDKERVLDFKYIEVNEPPRKNTTLYWVQRYLDLPEVNKDIVSDYLVYKADRLMQPIIALIGRESDKLEHLFCPAPSCLDVIPLSLSTFPQAFGLNYDVVSGRHFFLDENGEFNYDIDHELNNLFTDPLCSSTDKEHKGSLLYKKILYMNDLGDLDWVKKRHFKELSSDAEYVELEIDRYYYHDDNLFNSHLLPSRYNGNTIIRVTKIPENIDSPLKPVYTIDVVNLPDGQRRLSYRA